MTDRTGLIGLWYADNEYSGKIVGQRDEDRVYVRFHDLEPLRLVDLTSYDCGPKRLYASRRHMCLAETTREERSLMKRDDRESRRDRLETHYEDEYDFWTSRLEDVTKEAEG